MVMDGGAIPYTVSTFFMARYLIKRRPQQILFTLTFSTEDLRGTIGPLKNNNTNYLIIILLLGIIK
jgi:hypothetical protein